MPSGVFIYSPPFKIDHLPSKTEMFGFYADDGLFIKGL